MDDDLPQDDLSLEAPAITKVLPSVPEPDPVEPASNPEPAPTPVTPVSPECESMNACEQAAKQVNIPIQVFEYFQLLGLPPEEVAELYISASYPRPENSGRQ